MPATPEERRERTVRERMTRAGYVGLALVLILVAVTYVVVKRSQCDLAVGMSMPVPARETVNAPGIRETAPPWPAEAAGLSQRLHAFHLTPVPPAIGRRAPLATVHLDVFYKGIRVAVPAGFGSTVGVSAPINTNDSSGTVSLATVGGTDHYTLAQIFGVWGVRLAANRLGDACNRGASVLRVYVDGTPDIGDVSNVALGPRDDHSEIVVAYGTSAQLPHPIPSTYDFSAAASPN